MYTVHGIITTLSLCLFRWYCHFDDDMYVNSPELQDLLSGYPFEGKHYLGRWSVSGKKRLKVGHHRIRKMQSSYLLLFSAKHQANVTYMY